VIVVDEAVQEAVQEAALATVAVVAAALVVEEVRSCFLTPGLRVFY
jgi:hypothetical protein